MRELLARVSAMSEAWDRAAEALKARDLAAFDQRMQQFHALDRELRKQPADYGIVE